MFFTRCHHEAGSGVGRVPCLPRRRSRHQRLPVRLAGSSNSPLRVKTMLRYAIRMLQRAVFFFSRSQKSNNFIARRSMILTSGGPSSSQSGQDYAERLYKAVASMSETSCQPRTSLHHKKWKGDQRCSSELFLDFCNPHGD